MNRLLSTHRLFGIGALALTASVVVRPSLYAQDNGALLDALVQEGVLTESRAEEIRAKLTRDYEKTSAGKLKLDGSIKELKLGGDIRLRYQYATQDAQAPTDLSNVSQSSQYRLRLRVNADYKLSDNFFAGFGLATTQNNDSNNQTFANGNGSGDYFQNYNIYINKVFLGWTPFNGVTLVGGKQPNPFYTTDLVWDADIHPTGFTEKIDLHKVFDFTGLELSLVAGQLNVSDNTESSANRTRPRGGITNRDGFVYETQLIASAQLNAQIKATVAPAFYWTNGASVNGNGGGAANGTVGTDAWATTDALQGLKLLLVPGDLAFKVFGQKTKVQWDFAYNFDGAERDTLYGQKATPTTPTSAVTNPVKYSSADKLAWLLGFQIGENKKKGDWSLLANYRQVGLSAIDPLINDSDWSSSYTNMSGYKTTLAYNLGNATSLALTYQYGENLRRDLGAGLNGAAGPGSRSNSVQIFQADLNVKF